MTQPDFNLDSTPLVEATMNCKTIMDEAVRMVHSRQHKHSPEAWNDVELLMTVIKTQDLMIRTLLSDYLSVLDEHVSFMKTIYEAIEKAEEG